VWPAADGPPLCADGAHEWQAGGKTATRSRNGSASSTLALHPDSWAPRKKDWPLLLNPTGGDTCARCSAWRGELGWEATVTDFVAHLVQVFDAARGVLRDDGSLWVNISGGYANEAGGQNGGTGNGLDYGANRISPKAAEANRQAGRTDKTGGLPKLNYLDVPGLLGRAMQQRGWIWRADMVLCKESPMPESLGSWFWSRCRVKVANGPAVRNPTSNGWSVDGKTVHFDERMGAVEWADCPGCARCEPNDGLILRRDAWRPTRATEALLWFVKGEKYWSDGEAVKVPNTREWTGGSNGALKGRALAGVVPGNGGNTGLRETNPNPSGRNAWSWMKWPSSGGGFAGAHYAAYPPDLAAWCIKASVPQYCCPVCGAGYARIIERQGANTANEAGIATLVANGVPRTTANLYATKERGSTITLGWKPTCACNHDAPPVSGEVLDMFGGSGSTAVAAERLGRNCTLIDLNPEYSEMQVQRVTADAPLLTTVTVAPAPGGRQLALFPAGGAEG
jgi:hypothetical protein